MADPPIPRPASSRRWQTYEISTSNIHTLYHAMGLCSAEWTLSGAGELGLWATTQASDAKAGAFPADSTGPEVRSGGSIGGSNGWGKPKGATGQRLRARCVEIRTSCEVSRELVRSFTRMNFGWSEMFFLRFCNLLNSHHFLYAWPLILLHQKAIVSARRLLFLEEP